MGKSQQLQVKEMNKILLNILTVFGLVPGNKY